ncbi:MAG: hypothetical protein ABSA76_16245 [Bacteroidales bacterium]
MSHNRKINIPSDYQQRLDYIGTMFKEMRLSIGKRQIDFVEEGVSRRQIQRAEYGSNISLLKLISLLDCYGYTLSDLDDLE